MPKYLGTVRIAGRCVHIGNETKGADMSVPNEPIPETPPMPEPGWTPKPPVEEPDPDRLPDEVPVPNPDENEEPPKHAETQPPHAPSWWCSLMP
ncbi:hypothetical protein Rhsp01_29870 [Rhizobium sp. NBRC 114257]|uniref:Chitin-binding protein n=2 Tax=Rhizobium/Agrobacterium group TaxID=227290 RepID=A0ABQ0Z572_9HYPH|nr:hypothetical protein RsS93_30420 [Rhizobium dioscoreae]GLU81811.1 hypothetical protein Rhsp01_29870 [Rhizobium sp. NBRC 114257]